MDCEPNTWVLYGPTPSPYMFIVLHVKENIEGVKASLQYVGTNTIRKHDKLYTYLHCAASNALEHWR